MAVGQELGGGVYEGATIRPLSLERRQEIVVERFSAQSASVERALAAGLDPTQVDPVEDAGSISGYDNVEDWFETTCASFRKVKLPVPERPGFMREDEWDVERVVALADQLGRKLDPEDVTPGLRKFAMQWIKGLPTPIDFTFLAQLRFEVEEDGLKQFSLGQAKGVLNCAVAAGRRERKAASAPKEKQDRITEDGMYRKDDVIYKVQFNKATGDGRALYAKKLVVVRDAERDEDGTIVTAAKVRFEYAKGAVYKLRPEHKMSLEEAKAFGALYGTCCNCGRTLTDEGSIKAGIGPICAKGF